MSFTKELITTIIHCGNYNLTTNIFNDQSTVDEIHQELRSLCCQDMPITFCLMFYHIQLRKFVKLNQNILNEESNIFRLDSPIIAHDKNKLELWVINMTNEYDTPTGIVCDETNGNDLIDTMSDAVSKEDIPVNTVGMNIDDWLNQDLTNPFVSNEQDDTNLSISRMPMNDEQELHSVYPNETQSNSNFIPANPSSDSIERDFNDLGYALLTNRLSIQNFGINNDHSSESITTGITMSSHTNPPIQTDVQFSTPSLIETQSVNPNRPYFSLDVKSEQKAIYKSDQFNQTVETRRNGYITRIQGIKNLAQKMLSVWPKVHIPNFFRNHHNVTLMVYVVSERLENGMRIWSKHRDKGFLPIGYTHNTQPINPIEFQVTRNSLTIDGDFKLDLRMTTLWNKLIEYPTLHQLDEQTTINLHPALHDQLSPRLLCRLRYNDDLDWNRICLSNFIRLKRSKKQSLPTISNTVRIGVTIPKRTRRK